MNLINQNDLEYQFNQLKGELNKLKHKKILMTGGLGFLGYNFLNFFNYLNIKKNYNVKVDVYDVVEKNNLPQWFFLYNKNISYKKCNIIKQKKFKNADYIIHAASIASPTYYRKYPKSFGSI